MTTTHHIRSMLLFAATVWMIAGCSGKPKAVKVPPINPEKSAQEAMAAYDKNGDGQLSIDELTSCPAIQGALGRYDKNRDKMISKEELVERFTMWAQSGIGVTRMICTVTLDQQPLSDANVEFIPEECMGGAIAGASGTTDKIGRASLAMDPSNLPSDLQELRGIHQGLYKIKITHPNINLPPKYNTETTLGKEVSAEMGETAMRIPLSSR
ncbi:MAG: hypothetical protein JW829_14750 [Pirellulales bacterium]|nr:hypothetical protein [Pirellulales bacterium]